VAIIIDDIELPTTDPCAAPFGLLHLFDPDTNTTYSSSGERLVNEPVCVFNQSNQTISNSTINDTPGRIASAIFDVTGDTIWINYLERDNFEQRFVVGTLEYDKSTLIATGESLNEGETLAINDTYRLIRDESDFFIYPGALQLAIRNDSLIADQTGKVAVGGVPTNTTQIRFIALDDVTIIGDIPKDFGSRRVFSNDGTQVAVPYANKIDVYDVTARTQNSALISAQ
jgi:hypothetical protein